MTLFFRKLLWVEAKEYCRQRGMNMPVFKTVAELIEVSDEFDEISKKSSKFFTIYINFYSCAAPSHFWVSATDIGREPGQFQWADGTPVDSKMWNPGYPNQFYKGREICVCLYTFRAKLYDIACSATAYVLCEVPKVPPYCFLHVD